MNLHELQEGSKEWDDQREVVEELLEEEMLVSSSNHWLMVMWRRLVIWVCSQWRMKSGERELRKVVGEGVLAREVPSSSSSSPCEDPRRIVCSVEGPEDCLEALNVLNNSLEGFECPAQSNLELQEHSSIHDVGSLS
ncbi:hypothetical protein Tco_0213689 [Tanacetum coccineum]